MSEKPKAIVVLSGGLDSTVAMSSYTDDYDVYGITFDYGQKAIKQEIKASADICKYYSIPHKIMDLKWLGEISNSALNNADEVPELDESQLDDMEICTESASKVWVPGRNIVFTSVATSFAESIGASKIIVGWDLEEANTFPDNSKEFLNAFNELLKIGSPEDIEISAPAIDLNKKEIVELGIKNNAPMDLSYSCYTGNDKHCGVCESCMRRKRAFKQAGINDPTVYEN